VAGTLEQRPARPGLTLARILLFGVIFAAVGIVWDAFSTLVFRTGFLGEAVPPIPAFISLLLLLALRPLLRRLFSRWGYHDGELLATYGFLTIVGAICCVNGLRPLVDTACVPYYGSPDDATLNYVRPYWPKWFAPTNPRVIRWLYQGSPTGAVPWRDWLVPMACMVGLLTLALTATNSLLGLFARRWIRDERLSYPIAELAVSLVSGEDRDLRGAARSLARTRPFWWGIGAALAFNLFWLVPACLPYGKIPPAYTDLNALFPQGPWRAGYIWFIRYNPVVLGLAVLVPSDVLFATWFSTLLLKMESVILALFGMDWATTFHLAGRQGLGGYFVQAALLLWLGRHIFLGAARSLAGAPTDESTREERGFLLLLVASSLGLVWVMTANQMPAWLAMSVVAMLLVTSLVNARIRSQVGVPIIYLHGGGALDPIRGLLFLIGGRAIASAGHEGVTALTVFTFLWLVTMVATYQADGYRLADRAGLRRSTWAAVSLSAVIFAALFGLIVHLSVYYHWGGEYLKWGPSSWPIMVVVKDVLPQSLSPARWVASAFGALTTLVYIAGQRVWVGWPLHPIGFITAGAIGGYIFAQFFLAWLFKSLALRYGGLPAYVRLRNFFLGMVMGHFTLAALWGLMGLFRFAPALRYTFAFY